MRRRVRPRVLGVVAALLAAAVVGGCGGGATAKRPSRSVPAKLALAQRTHELPTKRPPTPPRYAPGSASAVAAVEAFARAYINWNAQTVAGVMAKLAAASIGQARAEMSLAAGQTAGDGELQQAGIANSGTVEAVAPLARTADEYVVVTLESTTATDTNEYQGLRPAWHLTVATVATERTGRWVVSGWQPEN